MQQNRWFRRLIGFGLADIAVAFALCGAVLSKCGPESMASYESQHESLRQS
jgi:hypothetical protein